MDPEQTTLVPAQVVVTNRRNAILVDEIIRDLTRTGGLSPGPKTMIIDMTYGEG